MRAVTMNTNRRLAAFTMLAALAAASGRSLSGAEPQEHLIVKCEKPCASVVSAVAALGGEVTEVYDNLDAVAVRVPRGRVAELSAVAGADAVRKDVTVALPPPVDIGEAAEAQGFFDLSGEALEAFARDQPGNYNYNNVLTGASTIHAGGTLGQGMVVAVIDSGTQAAAIALGPIGTGTVIGGENFVPLTQDPVISATSRFNDWHGTAVGSMIAAHANFLFAGTSRIVRSLRQHAPGSVFPCGVAPFATCSAGLYVIPMLGTAPAAKIYALKVFPSQGGGAPESRIIAAMDRAITLRKNFNKGGSTAPASGTGTENDPYKYDALNIQVVNLSLGGPTLFAGRDLEDELTLALLDAGITVVTSAGNDGFAAMTGGSPGTGFGSLTIGASSTPVHERVLRDNQFGVGIGPLYRPFNGVQTAYFSSRGPTADGRLDPDLSANGFASYVSVFAAVVNGALVSCGAPGAAPTCRSRILFTSGTSFSSPTVAGAAALLRQAVPGASPIETRNALAAGANPAIVADGSGRFDQGPGFLDIPEALSLLASSKVKASLPDVGHHTFGKKDHFDRDDDDDELGAGGRSVIGNVRKLGVRPVQFAQDRFSTRVKDLLPGQVAHFFVPSDDRTDQLIVSLTEIVPEGPQNTLFGDDLFVMGVDAPTSFAVHRIESPPGSGGVFVNANSTFTIEDPQTGLVRLALQGDWTNAGRISATLTIERRRSPLSRRAAEGRIEQDDVIPFVVEVPAGASEAVFELFWKQNWGRYPTNDLDMLVLDPNLAVAEDPDGNPLGSTLSSPERAVITNPAPGTWTVLVNGFTVHEEGGGSRRKGSKGRKDQFTLRATADGEALRIRK